MLRLTSRQLSRNARDSALELTHAGFASVTAKNCGQHVSVPRHVLIRQTVCCDLPRNQKLPSDCELLVIEIARQANDFHSIAKRLRNSGQSIRGRDEQHLREIVIDLEIIVD